jgi:hypothetical protein
MPGTCIFLQLSKIDTLTFVDTCALNEFFVLLDFLGKNLNEDYISPTDSYRTRFGKVFRLNKHFHWKPVK